jgi:hypothetical protein
MTFMTWLRQIASLKHYSLKQSFRKGLRYAPRPRREKSYRPALEALEGRCLPVVFTVTTTLDAGPGSIDEAILASNATPGHNTINFDIPGTGVQTIRVGFSGGPLPAITNPVTIDGYSQPGAQPSSLARGDNAVLLIQLDGSYLTYIPEHPVGDGLDVFSSGVTIQGLVIDYFPNNGIAIRGSGATGDVIVGNFIGTDPTGTVAEGNGWSGISIDSSAHGNTIGGTAAAARNVISGNANNGVGIYNAGAGNVVEGNFLGTDVTGTAAVANGWSGVTINYSSGNVIGGTTPGAANVCSGNTQGGIGIWGTNTSSNVVEGNLVGTDVTGTVALANQIDGIGITSGASGNIIGGTTPGARNVCSGNAGEGVSIWGTGTTGNVVEGNYVGTDATGANGLPNRSAGVAVAIAASYNTIGGATAGARNIISSNTQSGVTIFGGASNNAVQGNFIGTDVTGTVALGNCLDNRYVAVTVAGVGTSNNLIGGTAGGAGNVISGNRQDGLAIFDGATNTIVQGNYIGTDMTGTVALPNTFDGVAIDSGASGNTVGGTAPGARNVISGNARDGVLLGPNSATTANVIQGNFIGTDVSGTHPLGNGRYGVRIHNGSTDNLVGGAVAGAGNVIASNINSGVDIADSGTTGNLVQGNFIGTDVTGTLALGNADGVVISDGASDNKVGGYSPEVRNVISGNIQNGVNLYGADTKDNVVEGDYIGVNAAGTAVLGNALDGVSISAGAIHNTIGTEVTQGRNIISGNGRDGVAISDDGTSSNVVAGSYIGTDVTGTAPLGNARHGVSISNGASQNVIGGGTSGVRNVISGNRQDGITIFAASDNGVGANYIGTDVSGTAPLRNFSYGVEIFGGASHNVIGGEAAEDPESRNVISGNTSDGVNIHDIGTSVNAVANNYIGTDWTGNLPVANLHDGVDVSSGASGNVIGGNLISGNAADGLDIIDAGSAGNFVVSNYVGTNAAGRAALGNAFDGVKIRNGAGGNIIGGPNLGDGNLISGNGYDGVSLNETGTGNSIVGNLIGTDKTGTTALGNAHDGVDIQWGDGHTTIGGTAPGAGNVIAYNGWNGVEVTASLSNGIHQNSIFANGLLGIALNNGGNNNQPAPQLTSVVTSSSDVTIQGTLDAAANTTYTLEFFSNPGPGPNGKFYLGTITVTTDASGHADFTATFDGLVSVGDYITATATDPVENTSEFSIAQIVT